MNHVVGYVVYFNDEDFIVCEECVHAYKRCEISSIYEDEAIKDNLMCSECGEKLVEYDLKDDCPYENCPLCGNNNYFSEELEDGSWQCNNCFYNTSDDGKPSLEEYKKFKE